MSQFKITLQNNRAFTISHLTVDDVEAVLTGIRPGDFVKFTDEDELMHLIHPGDIKSIEETSIYNGTTVKKFEQNKEKDVLKMMNTDNKTITTDGTITTVVPAMSESEVIFKATYDAYDPEAYLCNLCASYGWALCTLTKKQAETITEDIMEKDMDLRESIAAGEVDEMRLYEDEGPKYKKALDALSDLTSRLADKSKAEPKSEPEQKPDKKPDKTPKKIKVLSYTEALFKESYDSFDAEQYLSTICGCRGWHLNMLTKHRINILLDELMTKQSELEDDVLSGDRDDIDLYQGDGPHLQKAIDVLYKMLEKRECY